MKDNLGFEHPLFIRNINWEPDLTPKEKSLLQDIEFKCRLQKEASTESNKTIGLRLSMRPDEVSKLLRSLEKKGWIKRIRDYRETSQRRIERTDKMISLIKQPFINWYLERVGKYAYPPLTKEELISRANKKEIEENFELLIERGWIKN